MRYCPACGTHYLEDIDKCPKDNHDLWPTALLGMSTPPISLTPIPLRRTPMLDKYYLRLVANGIVKTQGVLAGAETYLAEARRHSLGNDDLGLQKEIDVIKKRLDRLARRVNNIIADPLLSEEKP